MMELRVKHFFLIGGLRMKRSKIIEITLAEKDGLLERIKSNDLTVGDQEILTGLIEFNSWLQHNLQEKSISINRLQKMFGSSSEKRNKKKSDKDQNKSGLSAPNDSSGAAEQADTSSEDNSSDAAPESDPEPVSNVRKYAPNNGRMGHNAYSNAEIISYNAPYKAGDACPDKNCNGKLQGALPNVELKVIGQSFAKAQKHVLNKCRCNLCGAYFSAKLPADVCGEKYDPAFKAQLCVYKHFLGVPNYRLQGYQKFIGVPLPDSTQFDKIEDVANCAHPVFKQMERFAANGHLAHGDDTGVTIQSLIKENKLLGEDIRKGMFTTGVISFYKEHQIHLFYSGRKHCGENMLTLLGQRDPNLPMIKYMCDALPCNMPTSLKAIIINCLIHGRRNFTDIDKFYPEECAYVIDVIGKIYEHDAAVREQNLNDEERLQYHQQHSAEPMENLRIWLQEKLDRHEVEPNSSLGRAFKYMLKRWERLTQFLRIAGAPLDNNILERALKLPIRVRKNSLFYATEHGAYVGSMLQSLISTCIAQSINPVEYLIAIQVHKTDARLNPSAWMPWNYQATITAKAMPQALAA